MADTITTRVERIRYGNKDTVTQIAQGEDLTVYKDGDGLILECFTYGAKGQPHTGHRMHLSAEAFAKLKRLL